jgi:hypothetical protein
MPLPWTGYTNGSSIYGTGWQNECASVINDILEGASEYDKWASSTATTITTLIPVLLSLWGIPTADVHELCLMGKPAIAFVTAGFTFGLPVRQIKITPTHRDIYPSEIFEMAGTDDIEPKELLTPKAHLDIFNRIIKLRSLKTTQNSPQNSPQNSHQRSLSRLQRLVDGLERWVDRYAPDSRIFCFIQALLFFLMYAYFYYLLYFPGFSIWSCASFGISFTFWFLIVGFIIVGSLWIIAIRLFRASEKLTSGGGFETHIICERSPLWAFPTGIFQAFMTIAFTVLFSGIYGASMKAALYRSMVMVFVLTISRVYSILAAKSQSKTSPLIKINCETEVQCKSVSTLLSQCTFKEGRYRLNEASTTPRPTPRPAPRLTGQTQSHAISGGQQGGQAEFYEMPTRSPAASNAGTNVQN